jgi:hypothetical protein
MKFKALAILAVVCVVAGAFSVDASAGADRNPASLLLFPFYNTEGPNLAVITITNTCPDPVWVRLVWIDEDDCTPEDQWIYLTGYDTFTFLDRAMNPEPERGFMYAYVVEANQSVNEVAAECLIGQELAFQNWDGTQGLVDYGINAVGFHAIQLVPDGKLHLDGVEYSLAPKTIYFPRFFGQDGFFQSKVFFVNLTGGKFYNALVNILVFNDNEYSTSTTYEFPCWYEVDLIDVSGFTDEAVLEASMQNPLELWDGNPNPNDPHKNTGWIEMTGDFAYYFINQIDYASFYAVLVETIGGYVAADLPWQIEDGVNYINGMLWSTNPSVT